VRLFRRSRNRRIDRRRRRSLRALRTLAPLIVAAAAVALLRLEPTPDTSSMGFGMDRRALPELELPELPEVVGRANGPAHTQDRATSQAGSRSSDETHAATGIAALAAGSAAAPEGRVAQADSPEPESPSEPGAMRRLGLPLRRFLRAPWLHLRRVHFLGLRRVEASSLAAELGLSPEQALLDIDPAELCADLLATERFAECSGIRVPPGTLLLALRERSAIAVVEETGRGLSEDGRTFSLEPGEAGARPRVAGDAVRALPYLEACAWAGIPLHRAEVHLTAFGRTHATLWVTPAGPRLLPGTDPIASLLRYRALAQAGAFESADVEIDLRFRGRVVVRKVARIRSGDDRSRGDERKRA